MDQGDVWLYMLLWTIETQVFFNPYHFAGEDQSGSRGIWRYPLDNRWARTPKGNQFLNNIREFSVPGSLTSRMSTLTLRASHIRLGKASMVASCAQHSSASGSRFVRCSFRSWQFTIFFCAVRRSEAGADSKEAVERGATAVKQCSNKTVERRQ